MKGSIALVLGAAGLAAGFLSGFTVGRLEREGRADSIAVYFGDLDNGPWIGHHEKRRFVPASLAKMPAVIAAFRKTEADPAFLARRVVHEGLEEERDPGFAWGEVERNMERSGHGGDAARP